jgi:hypothetical protein
VVILLLAPEMVAAKVVSWPSSSVTTTPTITSDWMRKSAQAARDATMV